MRNHSKHGIIVDNVSYFENYQPKEDILNIRELKQINSQFIKHINKQRKIVRRHGLLYIYRSIENDKVKIKYAGKKRKFDYRSMFKYYTNKFSNIKHTYQKIQCHCNKRMMLKSGYAGQAVLRNETIMSIGCLKFKFTYSMQEVPNVYTQDISKYYITGERKPLNGLHIQFQSEQEEINVTKGFQSLIPLVNKYGSLKEIGKVEAAVAAEDKNVYSLNEQNIVNHLHMEADSVNHVFSNNNTEIDDIIQNNVMIKNNDNFEEETVHEFPDNNITECVATDAQDRFVEDDGKPVNQESLPGPSGQHKNFNTEHLYCACSPLDKMQTIIISSDDEYYGYDDC